MSIKCSRKLPYLSHPNPLPPGSNCSFILYQHSLGLPNLECHINSAIILITYPIGIFIFSIIWKEKNAAIFTSKLLA